MARTVLNACPDKIGPDEPILLKAAAEIAFPDGSMGVSGLRRERDRGNLIVERICGREYVTLAEIGRMREKCRARRRVPDYTCDQSGEAPTEGLSSDPPTSSETAASCARRDLLLQTLNGLKGPSANTSAKSTRSTEPSNVLPMKSG